MQERNGVRSRIRSLVTDHFDVDCLVDELVFDESLVRKTPAF